MITLVAGARSQAMNRAMSSRPDVLPGDASFSQEGEVPGQAAAVGADGIGRFIRRVQVGEKAVDGWDGTIVSVQDTVGQMSGRKPDRLQPVRLNREHMF